MIALLLVGCGPETEESPKSLEEMTQLAISDFDTEAEAENVAGLVDWMAQNADAEVDGYYFAALPEAVIADVPHSDDIMWDEFLGAAVNQHVEGTVAQYAAASAEPDQRFADPSYSKWDREILRGDVDSFLAGGELDTQNFIEKTNLGITIPYMMYKDFRWFDGALLGVSWVPEAGYDDAGDNGIVGGVSVEIWVEDGAGTRWYNGQWSDLKTLMDDYMNENPTVGLDLLISGTIDYMHGTESHVLGE